jgi:DNA-cytosine methyltransferase
MSCGKVALERAGIPVTKYYASEIDKYALAVSKANHSDIIQLGDIKEWKSWELPKIDLIIGGSPCQGFSFAGKQLNFDDPRSSLFFEYIEILRHYKPKYFLLENVKMRKDYQDAISGLIGVEPILINSALVSAQNRNRLYWTNIPNITQPQDRGILLKNILETGVVDRDKSYCIDACYYKGTNMKQYITKARRQVVFEPTAFTERRTELGKAIRREYRKLYGRDFSPRREKEMAPRTDGKMNCLTATYSLKEHTLIDEKLYYRKLTPIECERLQTIPDNYTDAVSNTQRYKMLGNGWTVEVIEHIFKHMQVDMKRNVLDWNLRQAYIAGLEDGVKSGYNDGWERGFDAGVEDSEDSMPHSFPKGTW